MKRDIFTRCNFLLNFYEFKLFVSRKYNASIEYLNITNDFLRQKSIFAKICTSGNILTVFLSVTFDEGQFPRSIPPGPLLDFHPLTNLSVVAVSYNIRIR